MIGPKFSSIKTDADRMTAAEEHETQRQDALQRMAQPKAARLATDALRSKNMG